MGFVVNNSIKRLKRLEEKNTESQQKYSTLSNEVDELNIRLDNALNGGVS